MPAGYAHRRFGEDVMRALPEGAFPEIAAETSCFALGLHGPDLLFYYHPLFRNRIAKYGNYLHEIPAKGFFKNARDIYYCRGQRPEDLAYLYGFLCHFALDSACHGEVARQMQLTGHTHMEVEAAFEGALLAEDGRSAKDTDLCAHLTADEKAVSASAAFLCIDGRKTRSCIKAMKTCTALLNTPSPFLSAVVHGALTLVGQARGISAMTVPEETPADLAESNRRLRDLYGKAVTAATELIANYRAFLAGEEELDARLCANYE